MTFKNTKTILFASLIVAFAGISSVDAALSQIQFWIDDDDPHFGDGEIYFHAMQDSGRMLPVVFTLYDTENQVRGEPVHSMLLNGQEREFFFQILPLMEDGEWRIDMLIYGMTLSREFIYIK